MRSGDKNIGRAGEETPPVVPEKTKTKKSAQVQYDNMKNQNSSKPNQLYSRAARKKTGVEYDQHGRPHYVEYDNEPELPYNTSNQLKE